MLTTMEIPGLYVQPDTGCFYVFDHIIAQKVDHNGAVLRLKLTNPTRFEAELKVLSRTVHGLPEVAGIKCAIWRADGSRGRRPKRGRGIRLSRSGKECPDQTIRSYMAGAIVRCCPLKSP